MFLIVRLHLFPFSSADRDSVRKRAKVRARKIDGQKGGKRMRERRGGKDRKGRTD